MVNVFYAKKFKNIFGVENDFCYNELFLLTGKYYFDIVKFDDWLHTQGYMEEKHGSMHDYIIDHYGKKAIKFIETLIENE